MQHKAPRTVCWIPMWSRDGIGLEHVLLANNAADSSLLAIDEDGEPFRLSYRLLWDEGGAIRHAELHASTGTQARHLLLQADGRGRWLGAQGEPLAHLDGCIDLDIWPTPLTNSLPIWRRPLKIGERREFRTAWVSAPSLTVEARQQAYTRLEDRLYRFESLDGTGFTAALPVDEEGLVIDYPELFRRLRLGVGDR